MKTTRLPHRTPTEKILNLLRTFRCLEKSFNSWRPKVFDPEEFYTLADGLPRGEKLCALFLLTVWNPSYARERGWEFNVMEFANAADDDAKAAFTVWLIQPVWP